jgi:hypothetical protein
MNLFAYGTLMTLEGWRAALGERARTLRFREARLAGWRRIWNAYREDWQGGVLNIEPHAGAQVVGVLVEGLEEDDFALLDLQEATHLPRRQVYVSSEGEEAVSAQIYYRQRGNHEGEASPRYRAVVLQRARNASPAVYQNLSRESVDAFGRPLDLG